MTYRAIASPIADPVETRNSISGTALMPLGNSMPKCKCCESPMQLFLQFDVEQRFALPFKHGSHFVLFMCPHCNEIPSFENFAGRTLPENYWDRTEGNHYAALFPAGKAYTAVHADNLLQLFDLEFVEDTPDLQPNPYIRVAGHPRWVQDEERFTCSCGGQMQFLAEISENFPFPKLESSPPQPDSFSRDDYCLFLGNEVYVFACENQCNERAIWITVQN